MCLESKLVGNSYKIFCYIHFYPVLGKYLEFFQSLQFLLLLVHLMLKFIQYVLINTTNLEL